MTSALPHVAYVVPGLAPLTLHVRWQEGGEGVVDVSGLVSSFRVYAPLRDDSALFAQARVGEHGTDVAWRGVAWTEEIDMAANTLWRLAQEQSGATQPAHDGLLRGGQAAGSSRGSPFAAGRLR